MRASEVLHIGPTLVLLLLLVPAASAQSPPPTVIAGTGEEITDDASRGDGGPATEGRFHRVDGLDWSLGGSILVADGDDGRIRRITPSGNIVTNRSEGLADPIAVVGTGSQPSDPFVRHNFVAADVGDDTVESWFLLSDQTTWTESVAMEDVDAADIEAADTGYWVADPSGETVWYVTFIGFPTNAWSQSPVLEGLNEPEGIGPLPGGGFLVATNGDCRIRRHTDNGTVVLAGTGFCAGFGNGGNGDGGPATASHLGFPTDVEATPDGGFVLTERDRVRRVAPDGKISTLYVTGLSISPDFPPPEPTALELTPDGDVLIGLSRRVLRFDTNYAPPANPTPTPTPNPQPPPPPGPDTTTPGLTLGGKKTQKAGKTVSVVVSATTEDLYASASGIVSIPAASKASVSASKTYRLKSIANRFVASGTKATLKLKVPKAALKAIKRALRGRKKVKASIKLTARDGAGNLTTGKRTVKLKR
jgi:glucose/arabinose dehydrogenase